MSHSWSICIENSHEAIGPAIEDADAWLKANGVSSRPRNFVRLAIEELATNWIKYGCGHSCEHAMTFHLHLNAGQLVFESTDNGTPFDPLAITDPEITLPLQERKPGGLGILLLRKLADRLSYDHRNGMNVLRIEKSFNPIDHEQT